MSPKRAFSAQEAAETVAIQALSSLASQPAQLGRFLAETGLGPDTLRAAASDPKFLAAVLNFVLNDAVLLKDFAADSGIPASSIAAAYESLGGQSWERDIP